MKLSSFVYLIVIICKTTIT